MLVEGAESGCGHQGVSVGRGDTAVSQLVALVAPATMVPMYAVLGGLRLAAGVGHGEGDGAIEVGLAESRRRVVAGKLAGGGASKCHSAPKHS